MRVCLSGKDCQAGEEWANALFLATPTRLSGAVHVAARGCVGPFGKRGGVTLARAGGPDASAAAATPKRPAKALDPKVRRARARALLREGKVHLDAGNFERARKSFLEAIEVDPEVPEAYNGVGVTFRMRNALGEALAWYKKALSADPDFGDAYYNMACIYSLQGKGEMALRYLRIAALNGYVSGEGLDADPDLEPVRKLAGYQALRSRM
jgi:Flp pilus assembly protein TadD